jgi:hypothetical protein
MRFQKNVKVLLYCLSGIIVLYISYLGYTLTSVDIVNFNPFNIGTVLSIQDTIRLALGTYDPAIVANAEKMYRLESANFTSGQFNADFGAGMEAFRPTFPYAWDSLSSFWTEHPTYAPIGLDSSRVDRQTGKGVTFLKFANFEAGFFTLCQWLDDHSNDVEKWNPIALNPPYSVRVNNQQSTITNGLV